MNRHIRRSSAAMLALVVCLTVAPISSAKQYRDFDGGTAFVRERIVRIVQSVQRFFGGLVGDDDGIIPPRPTP